MHRFSWHITLMLCFGLVACTADRRDSLNGEGQATFKIKDLSGSSERGPIRENSPWNVSTSIVAGFRACLQDGASNQILAKQDFVVGIPGSTIVYNRKTDEYGCLSWTEDAIPFNQFAGKSGWVTLKRTITGQGVNTGTVTADIALNPWATGSGARDSGKSVVFLRDGDNGLVSENLIPANDGISFLSGDGKSQGAAQLIIQDVKIQSIPEAEGDGFVTLGYSIQMTPKIRTRRANGEYFYDKVADGDFNIWLQVLAAQLGPKMDQRAIVLGGENSMVGKVVDGILRAEVRIRQERRSNQGSLELALKVEPRSLSSLAKIKPFNGVYLLGMGTVLEEDSGTIKKECLDEGTTACDFATVLEKARNYKELVDGGYIRPNQRYVFNNLRLRFLMVQSGETATQRTVAYTASTCVTDKQTGKPLANMKMTIRYLNSEKPERDVFEQTTDDYGCLNWDGYAFHKYYESEKYFERNISIEKGDFKERFTFYINPWDTNINFGFDAREFTADKIKEITHRRTIESRFFIGGYQYHTVRFLYNIDPFMDLEVKKTVLMELKPEVLRYSGIKDARKMTERVRDGIYLLKVAIQKSYLDPRDNSHVMISDDKYHAKMEKIGGRELATKEFITTNIVLVRVVSGLIIVPIELTMRDLRLMRVRSNFLMQLETVDERLIQAYHVFKDHASSSAQLEQKLKEFREKLAKGASLEEVQKQTGSDFNPVLKNLVEERNKLSGSDNPDKARKDLEEAVAETQRTVSASLVYLKKQLEGNSPLSTYLNASGKDTAVPKEALEKGNITSDFSLNETMLEGLKTAMNINDFSTVALPSKEEVDLNLFIEEDSGLKKRTFVGPVIFLSNAYGDSARATDNLDEAGCMDPDKKPDLLRLSRAELYANLKEKDIQIFGHPAEEGEQASSQYPAVWLPETQLEGKRQNNAYQFNKYFGALTHLCYKNVDNLIEDEKKLKAYREDQSTAISLKSNFIDFVKNIGMNLEFVSLTDEPLVRLKPNCDGHTAQCLETTTQGTVPAAKLNELVNTDLDRARGIADYTQIMSMNLLTGNVKTASRNTPWTKNDWQKLFFERSFDSRAGLCNLVANRLVDQLDKANGYGRLYAINPSTFRKQVIEACVSENGLIQDIKYHVSQTGQYTFLGGLNLNINVGQGFSATWSRSWSAGFEWTDVLGPIGKFGFGAGAGTVLKPFSLKNGVSLSDSDGTSINESTYLVSQIAGFQLDLTKYEKCVVVALSPTAMRSLRSVWGDNVAVRAFQTVVPFAKTSVNYKSEEFDNALRTGMMVCEGATRDFNRTASVKESYFYFTQHFTEGDMLDQAELYNHPWLLGMRGMRDFVAFSNRVRAQEVVGFGEFVSGATGITPQKKKAWALNHMTWIYENVFPSFPGFYTVLERGEDINAFLLEQSQSRLSQVDRDPLGEVTRRQLMINPGVSQMGVGPSGQ